MYQGNTNWILMVFMLRRDHRNTGKCTSMDPEAPTTLWHTALLLTAPRLWSRLNATQTPPTEKLQLDLKTD